MIPETLLTPGRVAVAHARLARGSRHRHPPDDAKLKPDCLSSQEKDDMHLGQFGQPREHPHSTRTWKGAHIQ